MGKKKITWVADDGSEHDSERSMQLRDLQILDEKEIEVWVSTLETSDRRRSEYAKIVKQWQAYVREQEMLAYEAARQQEVTKSVPELPPTKFEYDGPKPEARFADDPDFAGAKLI